MFVGLLNRVRTNQAIVHFGKSIAERLRRALNAGCNGLVRTGLEPLEQRRLCSATALPNGEPLGGPEHFALPPTTGTIEDAQDVGRLGVRQKLASQGHASGAKDAFFKFTVTAPETVTVKLNKA